VGVFRIPWANCCLCNFVGRGDGLTDARDTKPALFKIYGIRCSVLEQIRRRYNRVGGIAVPSHAAADGGLLGRFFVQDGGVPVALLDSSAAGRPLREFLPDVPDLPIVASMEQARPLAPDALVIGVAPTGGELPEPMRRHVRDALTSGVSVISGLHTLLREDPEFVELAERSGARLHDMRDPGPFRHIASGRARTTRAKRVLTVGTDCSVGKMVAALELREAAVRAGLDAAFVATGQTGIMIEGWGIAVDHVLADFAAGAAELLVQHAGDRDVCFIEGQGSIEHPAYSGVTVSLLHGTCPDAMILCHRPDRRLHNQWPDCPVASISDQIGLYEQILAPLHPGKVVAVAVNTAGMEAAAAREAIDRIAAETGLPAEDPIRDGCRRVLAAVRRHTGV